MLKENDIAMRVFSEYSEITKDAMGKLRDDMALGAIAPIHLTEGRRGKSFWGEVLKEKGDDNENML